MEIPTKILSEFKKTKESFSHAWIGFDSSLNNHFVSIIPYEWKKSNLLILKIL